MSETKTKVNRETPSISIVRRTIQVKQGDNAIYMTKNDVNLLRMLREGQFDGSVVKRSTTYTIRCNERWWHSRYIKMMPTMMWFTCPLRQSSGLLASEITTDHGWLGIEIS